MNSSVADSSAPPPPGSDGWLAGPPPPAEGWTRKKFFYVLALVLILHVALICLFGTKKAIVPRTVTNVPHLQLADHADEFIALGDPTLFARPNAQDVVTAYWRSLPAPDAPSFDRTEPPLYLPPDAENFGAAFRAFMRNSQPAALPLNLKPEPQLILPDLPPDEEMPSATTMQISGDLAGRPLLNSVELPSLPRNDVLEPSRVQALVDPSGNVVSAIILKPIVDADADILKPTVDTEADQRALQLTRALRFTPAPQPTFGEIIFVWHTVSTNAAPAKVP